MCRGHDYQKLSRTGVDLSQRGPSILLDEFASERCGGFLFGRPDDGSPGSSRAPVVC